MRATPWRLRLNRLNLALSSDDVLFAICVQCRIHSCIIRGKGVVCPNSDPILVLKLVFSKLGKPELILCTVPIFQCLASTVAEISIGVPNFLEALLVQTPANFNPKSFFWGEAVTFMSEVKSEYRNL